jgi:hypothetical protein
MVATVLSAALVLGAAEVRRPEPSRARLLTMVGATLAASGALMLGFGLDSLPRAHSETERSATTGMVVGAFALLGFGLDVLVLSIIAWLARDEAPVTTWLSGP